LKGYVGEQKRTINVSGSYTRDADEGSSLPDGQISCRYPNLPKSFDLNDKSKLPALKGRACGALAGRKRGLVPFVIALRVP